MKVGPTIVVNKQSLGVLLLPDVGLDGLQQGIWRVISEVNKGNKVTLGVDYTLIRSDLAISTLGRLQNIGVSIRIHEYKLFASEFLEDIRSLGWRLDTECEIYLADDDGISFLDLDEIALISKNENASIFHPKVNLEIINSSVFGAFNEYSTSIEQKNYYSKYLVIRDVLVSAIIEKEVKACFCLASHFHTLNEKVELDVSKYKEKAQ